jgi:hypothetical protein
MYITQDTNKNGFDIDMSIDEALLIIQKLASAIAHATKYDSYDCFTNAAIGRTISINQLNIIEHEKVYPTQISFNVI